MGLGPSLIWTLIDLRRSGSFPDHAHVVEIGAQQLADTFLRSGKRVAELQELFGRERRELGQPARAAGRSPTDPQPADAPSSQAFWQSLGCSYAAIEYGGHRGVIAFDLNRDTVSDGLRGSADLVVNCGTTEHVMNQDNAFRAIHDLAKPNGVMFHEVPCAGLLTHGVVGYTASFFWLLCRYNQYQVIELTVRDNGDAMISPDIDDSNRQFGRPWALVAAKKMLPVISICAVLRKTVDQPYVTPIDVPA